MARLRQEGLTTREMELIQVLWQQKEATVEVIQAKLPNRLEGSTIRTLLQIMEDKGYVTHEKQGRANVYRPIIEQQRVQSSAMKHIIQKLFGGSTELLLARLVEDEEIDMDDVARLREKLKQRKGRHIMIGTLVNVLDPIAIFLLDATVKTTLFMGLVLLAVWLLDTRQAAKRSLLLNWCLVGVLVIPIASLCMPSLRFQFDAPSFPSELAVPPVQPVIAPDKPLAKSTPVLKQQRGIYHRASVPRSIELSLKISYLLHLHKLFSPKMPGQNQLIGRPTY